MDPVLLQSDSRTNLLRSASLCDARPQGLLPRPVRGPGHRLAPGARMSGPRRIAPPSTPQSILRRRALERGATARPEEWGVDSKSLRMPANSDVDACLGAGGKVVRARRQDVFDLLA